MTKTLSNTVLVRRIKRKIERKIREISFGYKVVESIPDGSDEYGTKYWVECRNGFHDRSWNINNDFIYTLKKYIKKIIENGIEYNRKLYFIRDTIFTKLFIEKPLRHTDFEDQNYKINFKIDLLTEEEFNDVKTNIEEIDRIIERIDKKHREIHANDIEKAKLKATKELAKEGKTLEEMYNSYYMKYIVSETTNFTFFKNKLKTTPKTSLELFSRESQSKNIIKEFGLGI